MILPLLKGNEGKGTILTMSIQEQAFSGKPDTAMKKKRPSAERPARNSI